MFSLIQPVDEFSLKELRMWDQRKFHLVIFVFGVNQNNLEAGGVQEPIRAHHCGKEKHSSKQQAAPRPATS